ncbi:MAG TPA: hypothetical protein VIR03_01665 [Candidatus Saccharimonadales bacterium]
MRTFLIILSTVITIVSILPYIVEIVRGKVKPRIVSWFTWTVLTAIACAASFADGQIPSGVLMLAATIETATIVVLGLRHGDRKFERFDVYCLLGALVGLLLWYVFDSPSVAVIAAVAVDFIGAAPTLKHCWQKPYEEAWLTFALAAIAGSITVMIAGSWAPTAIAYPLYIVLVNIVMTCIILASPHRELASEPAELREL